MKCLKSSLLGLLAIVLTLTSGCGTATIASSARFKVVMVDESSEPLDPRTNEPFSTSDAKQPFSFDDHLEKMMDDIKAHAKEHGEDARLVLFAHGGLNSVNGAIKRVNTLAGKMPKNVYPVFINWDTDWKTTIRQHLFCVREGVEWEVLGPFTSPLVLAEDLGRAILGAPMTIWAQARMLWRGYGVRMGTTIGGTYDVQEKLWHEHLAETNSGKNTTIATSITRDARGRVSKFTENAVNSIQFLASLVVSPLVLDAYGTGAWEMMKRRVYGLFEKPGHFDVEEAWKDQDLDRITAPNRDGALAQFLARLEQEQKGGTLGSLKVDLYGHSMGAIVFNRALRGWPDINFRHIVYLGAACSVDDFAASVLPYLDGHCESEFFSVMLHPVSEANSSEFYGFGGNGTLLVQIDNIYERTSHVAERTMGRWENMIASVSMIPERLRSRISLKTLGVGTHEPQNHGEFDDVEFWNEKFYRVDPATMKLPPKNGPSDPHPVDSKEAP